MSFVEECVKDSMPIWQACLEGDFLSQMEAGTLPEDCFTGYIVDDSLYLREYAKVFAAGILRSNTLAEIRTYYSFLSFVNNEEGSTRVQYLQSMGLSDEAIEGLPQRPENRAYTDFMISAVQTGETGAECMMAVLPCMISYAWIFHTIVERTPAIRQSGYWPLVRDYIDPGYDLACKQWSDYTDELCQKLTQEQKKHCLEIFRQSSLHELHFWEMSTQPRTDLDQLTR